MNLGSLTAIAEEELRKILVGLPVEIQGHLKEVSLVFEGRPGSDDLLPVDTLGVYDEGAPTPQIRIWLLNLWEYADADERTFREEVRITLLHEIGHALGWDEEEVRRRGLE